MDGTHRIALAALVGVVALTAFAHLARTGPEPAAEASAPAGGFTVASVRLLLDEREPVRLAGARLTVTPTAREVRVRVGPAGAWTRCRAVGTAVACTFTRPYPRVRDAGALEVVAVG
jgi:hypothetical protein